MKKKRVLALLLALSLAVSTNSMTVLATESGVSDIAVTIENNSGEADKVDSSVNEQEEEESAAEDEPDVLDGEEAAGENVDSEAGGDSDRTEDRDDEFDEKVNPPVDDENVQNPDEIGDTDGSDETAGSEQDADTEGSAAEDPEANEEETATETGESTVPRMMSFTDEVGILVTYNAAEQYQYVIDENGTLTAITKADGTEVDGNVVIDENKGITRIAEGAFTNNTKITYVKMPSGVTVIGENAFKGCTSLKGMTIPKGVSAIETGAFESCSSLTQFALPATVTSVGNRAFYGDTRLFMVYMKNIDTAELTSIGDYAFYGCTALAEFCSDTEFVFPDSLNVIGGHAFQGNSSIKTIVFPDNVTGMGEYAFASCGSLTDVIIPKNLDTVPQHAFDGCRSLVSVEFGSGNTTKTIESYAFKGCYNLSSVEFSFYISRIASFAFTDDCTKLIRVQIRNGTCAIEDDAFPDRDTLYLIGYEHSTAETYTLTRSIRFINLDSVSNQEYYTYKTETTGTGSGTLTVSTTASIDNLIDPNDENNKKGVPAGTKLYVITKAASGSRLVSGSLKCNGIAIKSENGWYTFEMPRGGALITAEFEITGGNTSIEGTDVTWELSNGDALKVGQSTRLFLLDTDNNIIPSAKIKYSSEKPTIAKISDTGVITALKEGSTVITVKVTGGTGEITKKINIEVVKTDVASLRITASSYDERIFTMSEKEVGDQIVKIASIDQISASQNDVTLELKAQAYDDDNDGMSVALKWTTSDAKVAKLASASTAEASSFNQITIPKGTSGEATITATATNADKKTITQKFIIQVKDYHPRLSSTSVTLNPNKEDGAVVQVISAYEQVISDDTFKLLDDDGVATPYFTWEYDRANSSGGVCRYVINAKSANPDEKTYSLKVSVNNRILDQTLKITVKSSIPNPKVAFDKKQQKINLFYSNDGTEVVPVITNLGNERVERYTLEPLTTTSEEDALFLENFVIDEETGVITQQSDSMILNEKGKPVTTGYLVLHFEGYKEDVVKKYKITIPTQTTKPSYKLDRTSDVYNMAAAEKTVTLSLLDKKTKEQIDLSEGNWSVIKLANNNSSPSVRNEDITINGDGQIEMIVRQNPTKGKVVLSVRNEEWASGQALEYTYNIKTTSANPTIKLQKTSVSLNSNYMEQSEEFSLVSNQSDTVLADEQTFRANSTAKNAAEYDKLEVSYSGGIGTVSILESDIKPGTYKFICDNVMSEEGMPYNKVTLSVKVANSQPAMTVKGTASLNLVAVTDGVYAETAELKLNVKLPAGYQVEPTETTGSITCTSKGMSEVVDKFNWEVQNDTLLISLLSPVNAQKYSFTMTPIYSSESGGNLVTGKPVKFTVKVYKAEISVKMTQKGTLNLLDREGEYTLKNSIVFTPTYKNLKDTVEEVRIFDAAGVDPELGDDESEYFSAEVLNGKVYVAPKSDAELENKKAYPIKMWVKLVNYGGYEGMWIPGILNIKTAQTLPKVTTNRTDVNLYLSNKEYEAAFVVTPKEGSVGKLAEVVFGEKDTKSQDSFDVTCIPQDDGSLIVHIKLKNTVSYAGNTTTKVTMYVVYEGQAVETVGPTIAMNVKINK